jgi:hypothetical protein
LQVHHFVLSALLTAMRDANDETIDGNGTRPLGVDPASVHLQAIAILRQAGLPEAF